MTGMAPLTTIPPCATGAKDMPPKRNSANGDPEVPAMTSTFQISRRGQRMRRMIGSVQMPATPNRRPAMS